MYKHYSHIDCFHKLPYENIIMIIILGGSNLKLICVLSVIVIFAAVLILIMKKNGVGRRQLICVGLTFASLILAYFLKCNIEIPTVGALIPFYKVAALTEYGYASILHDLVIYALPFVALGFFIKPAFSGAGLCASLISGLFCSLALNIPHLIGGGVFISDEYVFAAIGSAVGYSLYCIIVVLLSKTKLIKKLGVPVPERKARRIAYVAFAAVYFFIALVMIFDYGEAYSGIQFFDNSVSLPQQLSFEFEPETDRLSANVYAPSTQPVAERTKAVASALGISGEATTAGGVYNVSEGTKTLAYTQSGSWTYEDSAIPSSAISSPDTAIATVMDFFSTHQVLTVSVDSVSDIIAKSDDQASGYDVYLTTAIGVAPIIGSNTIMVSVRGESSITLIRKYDEDLIAESQVAIISQKEAVDNIVSGRCAYTLFSEAQSAIVTSCELAYMANSSQGYYLPIWKFSAIAKNGASETPFEIYVEAKR